ncbi:hypothetical protein V0288_16930 [Pannus brasiliensis CCIBt3594]|uniref:PEP-CTERM protein-sorting domain-containing protein n=1 Tax=Pannus brasiliensis CCIBt3594 TaxID=1427578 RepID=A0AAW9QUM9_9CHRO
MTSNFNQYPFKNPLVLSIASLLMFSITGCDYPEGLLGDLPIDVTSGGLFNTPGAVVEPGVDAFQASSASPEGIAPDLAADLNGVSLPPNNITPDNPELSNGSDPNPGFPTEPVTIPEPAAALGLLALGVGSVIQREINR